MTQLLHANSALARRLEAVEAEGNRRCVDGAAKLYPNLNSATLAIAGGWAMFHTPESPITQAFGVGMNGSVSDAEIDQLEEFFRSHGAASQLETCPLAHDSLRAQLNQRGYRVLEWSNVLVRRLPAPDLLASRESLHSYEAPLDEIPICSRVAAEGFFGANPSVEMVELFSTFHAGGARLFLARVNGEPAGTGGMGIVNGIVNCFGDATLERFRGRGAQAALIAARLATAAAEGAELAMATTMPGTISQRNYERAGYRIAYTRTKFIREWK